MTDKLLTPGSHALVAALANHLWQSTLVAVIAGLLTLALRKHQARTRYWLWLAASIKFLVPFSVLVSLGSDFAWHAPAAKSATPALYFALEEVSQPFTQSATRVTSTPAPAVALQSAMHLFPWIAAIWLCGFLAVLLLWTARWMRISAATKICRPPA